MSREVHARRHGHRVIEREPDRQLRGAEARDGQRQRRPLARPREDEHDILRLHARGQRGREADLAGERGGPGRSGCGARAGGRVGKLHAFGGGGGAHAAHRLGDRGAGSRVVGDGSGQSLPAGQRLGPAPRLLGRGGRQRQRGGVLRVDGQRLLDQRHRLAFESTLLRGQRIGLAGEQIGVVRLQGDGACIGLHRLRGAPGHEVGPGEHRPALGVPGLALQARGELLDHPLELRLGRGHRHRRADREVGGNGRHR
ncbi:MAG: hypothetical protein ACK559_20080, partial [bacterium]